MSDPERTAAPLADVIARPKSASGGRGTSILLGVAAAIAIGGLAFAGGRLTAPAAASTRGQLGNGVFGGGSGAGQGSTGQGFAGRGGFGGISIRGTVSAVSADSITVTLAGGTSVTIPLDASTTYHTRTPAAASAVTVGSQVAVTPGARAAAGNGGSATNGGGQGGGAPAPSGAPGSGRLSFGPASDVTVIGQ